MHGPAGSAGRENLAKPVKPERLSCRVERLHHAVGVEQQSVTTLDHRFLGLEFDAGSNPQRQRAGPQFHDLAACPPKHRIGMARADKSKSPVSRLEDTAEHGHEGPPATGVAQGAVHHVCHGHRIGVEIEAEPEGRVGNGHQQTRGDPVAAGIADDDCKAPVTQR